MNFSKITMLALVMLLTGNANSVEEIANIFFTDGNQFKHIEFTVTDQGIRTHEIGGRKVEIRKEHFGKHSQLPDGRIFLRPTSDGVAHRWNYNATRPGKYWMELVYSLPKGESTASPNVSSYRIATKLNSTGASNRFRNVNLGKIYFTNAGKQRIELAFNGETPKVRTVILRPAPEGEAISQALDRSILLHSRDATIHGVKLQYENKPHKNTLGYWVNVTDQVCWDFTVTIGGKFNVEIYQGCGTGHGGSPVAFDVDGQRQEFIVKDTGHFQNFIPRKIGTIRLSKGEHRFWIKPIKKANGAVMDLRRIRLIPIE